MKPELEATPKLGFGCMRLPLLDPADQQSIDLEQFKQMVDVFMEGGGTYFLGEARVAFRAVIVGGRFLATKRADDSAHFEPLARCGCLDDGTLFRESHHPSCVNSVYLPGQGKTAEQRLTP